METLRYTVELRTDAAFRSRAGAGPTVAFVPGITILGHLARHYAAAKARGLAWTIFHSGQVRFGDARLLDALDRPARPVPLSFFFPKGASGPTLQARDPRDGRREQTSDAPELQVWPDGILARVETRVDLKTAVEFDTQRAAEGQLFRLSTVRAGQRFGGVIAFEAGIDPAARDFVRTHLIGAARLGWSRRAEYGQATISLREGRDDGWNRHGKYKAGQVRIQLLSETCLLDPVSGRPTITPLAEHFPGLPPGAAFDVAQSYIRTCRFTPVNGHRHRPDMERIALQAGSVLVFTGCSGYDAQALRDALAGGVGLHRAEGLGQVCVNPPTAEEWRAIPAARPADPVRQSVGAPTDDLWRWLAHQNAATAARTAAEAERDTIIKALGTRTRPSPSQWRRVATAARLATSPAALAKALFGDGSAICTHGVAKHQWKDLTERLGRLVADTSPLGVALAAEELARAKEAARD